MAFLSSVHPHTFYLYIVHLRETEFISDISSRTVLEELFLPSVLISDSFKIHRNTIFKSKVKEDLLLVENLCELSLRYKLPQIKLFGNELSEFLGMMDCQDMKAQTVEDNLCQEKC